MFHGQYFIYRLYPRMYCYRHCMAFNAGSLSVYYCVKGPPTAQKSMYTELKAKPLIFA